ncbi:KAP family P-loop domain-containing protein [Rhizobium sp. AN5]|uniref:KAP family P-loop NTPase fold protein n=1 Tax=Rhizobium sp. AN5 TaxID=1855304 RepID=UPI000BCA4DC2|nr:P-loop NTPase fold protein [Rhizobium sp. AN5]SOC93547.1 KAP family P-loop domain-containing protein [Rhizobium sp. AN5]
MNQTVSCWQKDKLGRKQDAEFLYNYLVGQVAKRREQDRPGSYVLNVDSVWGGGKSFFLDGFAEDLEQHEHIVVRINAWKDDHAQDPYVAIMAAIDTALLPYTVKKTKLKSSWEKAKSSGGAIALRVAGAVTKGLIKKHTGVSLDDLGDIVSGDVAQTAVEEGGKVVSEQLEKLFDGTLEAMIEGFQTTEKATADFRKRLEKILEELGGEERKPIFILVDELDRCRPSYAVQLLERVKHLFDVDGIVFVFATNSDQLKHSIAGAYGVGFDGFSYLKRFFDRTYVFEEPSIEELVKSLCDGLPAGKIRAPLNKLDEAIWTGCRAMGFDLRAIFQVMEIIENAAVSWPHKIPMDVSLLFPVCANFYLTGKAKWPDDRDFRDNPEWVMKRYRRNHDGSETDRSFNLSYIYRQAQSKLGALSHSISAQRAGNLTEDYIFDIFSPEWNGIYADELQPSIQAQILPLVVNAGRLTSDR